MRKIKSMLVISMVMLFASGIQAQDTVHVTQQSLVALGPHLEYYVDSSDALDLNGASQRTFSPSRAEMLNLANLPHPVWIRFKLQSVDDNDLYLEVDNALLEKVTLYDVTDGVNAAKKVFDGGYLHPFAERPIHSENFQVHLAVPMGTTHSFYLHTGSHFPMFLPLTVGAKASFLKHSQQHNLFWGLYMGIIIFAFLYNLFIYTSVREKTYLYYILYILGSATFYLGLQGYSYKYLWPNSPALNTRLGMLICVTNIIITLFSMHFLQISKAQKWLYRTGMFTVWAYALIGLMNLTPAYPAGLGLAQLLSLITCIYFIYAAIRRLRDGVQSAKFYLIGWTMFLVLVMVYLLTINGVLPAGFFTTHSIFIGHMTEVLLLSFALADRINILKSENERKQAEIIRHLEENEQLQLKVNRELEDKVRERTAEVVRQKNEAEMQRARSDELLLNILPAETAEELKNTGKAKAKLISQVTVLFTDIKNFTSIAANMSPGELVDEINECFSAFDAIMGKYGVEKIKTIGDSYMAAGGLPVPNDSHAVDVVQAALDIQDYMESYRLKKEAEGKTPFRIRIGIHTGPVVAGIVGIKKFAYDIWGDTVNLASRMESAGEVGRVNMSEATYNLVKDKFHCEYRGKHEAKNKGMMDMYFVSR